MNNDNKLHHIQSEEKVAALELEHRDLDEVIKNLESQGNFDQLKLSRLKTKVDVERSDIGPQR